jgi:hypothetical protein
MIFDEEKLLRADTLAKIQQLLARIPFQYPMVLSPTTDMAGMGLFIANEVEACIDGMATGTEIA